MAANPPLLAHLAAWTRRTWLLRALARDGSWQVRSAVAANPACPTDVLVTLADDGDYEVYRHTLAHPNTTDAVREVLLGRAAWFGALDLATISADPTTDAATLRAAATLAASDRWAGNPLLALAGRPDLPDDLALTLADHSDPMVRRTLGDNPGCPAAALRVLAGDEHPVVRGAVRRNPSCPEDAAVASALLDLADPPGPLSRHGWAGTLP